MKMHLFLSGSLTGKSLPERALAKERPDVMLTFFEMHLGMSETTHRFRRHCKRRKVEEICKRIEQNSSDS